MDRLILIRHAKTEARAPSGEDFDRGLTDRGRRDAKLIAETLEAAELVPDRALVSAALRTRETWEAMSAIFPEATLETRPELYDADARVLLAAGQTPLGRTVAVVAHNPGLQVLTLALAGRAREGSYEARLRSGFPTGAAAAFAFKDDIVQALGLFYPSDYGGGPE
jgi:phosphohistidine phosphatase